MRIRIRTITKREDMMKHTGTLHGNKIRLTIILSHKANNIVDKIVRQSNMGRSKLFENLIMQKLQDPVEALTEEKRELAIRMNEIDKRISDLEE